MATTDELTELPDGALRGPNGVAYHRTPRRLKRKDAAGLVARGAPVVTSVYDLGMTLTWHDGPDAAAAWADIGPRLVIGKPAPVRDLPWIGHLWESEDGDPLLFFDGEH